jgi:uncharacterized protein
MGEKTGRNDPCPCGSGKKYKNCCQNKPVRKKLTAKWINKPQEQKEPTETLSADAQNEINLIERTFGPAIEAAAKADKPNSLSDRHLKQKDL